MMRLAIGLACLASLSASPAAAWSPRKAEPEPKLRDCPEVGAGYVRLPGSTTCVKVGGLVRVEAATVKGAR